MEDDLEDEILAEFLIESREGLERLDTEFVELEADPSSTEILGSIFRTVHTIKGTCGFLGLERLERVAHTGESLLDLLRSGEKAVDADITTALLAMVDAIRSMLDAVEAAGTDGDEDYGDLIATLDALRTGEAAPAAPASAEAPSADPAPPEPAEEVLSDADGPIHAPAAPGSSLAAEPAGEPLPPTEKATIEAPTAEPAAAPAEPADPAVATPPATPPARPAAERSEAVKQNETVRVDVRLLDRLMNLVGELVLTRNQILQASSDTRATAAATQQLNLITSELQEGVMKTRMQPIGTAWNKLPRLVRDASATLGKQVRFTMIGEDTELDRTIIEAIKDPLTHLVRNSLDHGIEAPDVRAAAGKDRTGELVLSAAHEGGQVMISLTDDGAGLNLERIAAKAVERGLVDAARVAAMSDRELAELVFHPGFSTAAKITEVSGRGVGMDVVKTNIERLGGTVDIRTSLGAGTTMRISIPLTLAIVPALVIDCAGSIYSIPQASLVELVRVDDDASIEYAAGAPVYRLRGNLLPLLHLRETLGAEPDDGWNGATIVVLRTGDRMFGLVVDEVRETAEIVVKPLGRHLKDIGVYSGTAIMGDGAVSLILDVAGIARRAEIASESELRAALAEDDADDRDALTQVAVLVTEVAGLRIGVPLDGLERIERFAVDLLEHAGTPVVQYRGGLLPIISFAGLIGAHSLADPDDELSVLVCEHDGHLVGLVVDRVIDAASEGVVAVDDPRSWVSFTAVIGGLVTSVADLDAIGAQARALVAATHGSLA